MKEKQKNWKCNMNHNNMKVESKDNNTQINRIQVTQKILMKIFTNKEFQLAEEIKIFRIVSIKFLL